MLSKMGYRAVLSPDGTGVLEKGSTKIELTQQHGIWIFCNPQECSHSRLNDLMHRRMGHLGADSLSVLLDPKNDMLARYEFTTAKKSCLPNMKALPFGIRDYTQAKSILDIIHTDLAGPMNVTALGGFKYIITFTDDWSRFITVYLLKNKNEATQAYKKFFNLVTNLHDKKIKRIHSDLGGEFMDTECKQHNESNGVLCSQAPRKTPQLNGVAEVANRILFNKARAMMADSNLPKELWGEAVLTAAF